MKYFVAHLLSGDAAEYHRAVTGELSERFKNTPLHEGNKLHASVARFLTYKKFRRVWLHRACVAASYSTRGAHPVRKRGAVLNTRGVV